MKRSELFFMFLLVPVDIAMIIASFVAAYFLRAHLHGSAPAGWEATLGDHFRYSLYLLPPWIAVLALLGLYEPTGNRCSFSNFCGLFIGNSVIMLFLGIAGFAINDSFFSGAMILWTPA